MLTAYDITGEEFHHTREDVESLTTLATGLERLPVIVNIGACFGTSALAFAQARRDAYIFSIDVRECPEEREALKQGGIAPSRVIRILARSQDVGLQWPWRIQMVFVDGAHDLESVKDDIRAWCRKVTAGGIMAFHDYGTPSLPHVKAAVDELMVNRLVRLGRWRPILEAGTIRAFRAPEPL